MVVGKGDVLWMAIGGNFPWKGKINVLIWVGETYCGEGKICYYWWCNFSVVLELRCIVYGGDLLW